MRMRMRMRICGIAAVYGSARCGAGRGSCAALRPLSRVGLAAPVSAHPCCTSKIATSTVAARRHPNTFPCVHKMPGGALRLLTRTWRRAHHRSPAVYVRSAVGSRTSKHRALAHPPSAPTICEVVRLPGYVEKLCASTDGHSPFAPRSCLTAATVLAKPDIGRGRCPCAAGLYRDQPPRAGALRRLQAAPCCFGVPRVYGGRFRVTARHDSENTTRSLTYASLSPLYNRAVRGV